MTTKIFGNIYFDTNILKSLDFNIHKDPKLTILREVILKPLGVDIFIPEIVLEELRILRLDTAKKKISRLKTDTEIINKWVTSKISYAMDEYKLIEEISKNIDENIKQSGIKVFNTSFDKIDIREITNKAVNKIRPFKEDGKGYKDMIILESILIHCLNK